MIIDNTQIIWIGTRLQLAKVSAAELTPWSIFRQVSNLCFMIHSQLNMADHVALAVPFTSNGSSYDRYDVR